MNKYVKKRLLILTAAALSCSVFLTSCKSKAQDPKENNTAEQAEQPDTEIDENTATANFELASQGHDWDKKEYEYGSYSFEIPEGWDIVEDYSNENDTRIAMLFTSTSKNVEDKPSNVVVELIKSPEKHSDEIDYSDKEVQQEFLNFLLSALTQQSRGSSNFESAISENPRVFKIDYDQPVGDVTVHRTCYYPTDEQYYNAVIYATDFNDDIEPSVIDVSEHIIESWEVDLD